MVISAMKDFATAFKPIFEERNLTPEAEAALQSRIAEYYQGNFLSKLADNSQTTPHFTDYFPNEESTQILQDLYIANNPNQLGSKHKLDVQATTAGTVTIMRAITRSCGIFWRNSATTTFF
jgi:methyl-accepting chemotaxis protein